jgi:hypothetical protein
MFVRLFDQKEENLDLSKLEDTFFCSKDFILDEIKLLKSKGFSPG